VPRSDINLNYDYSIRDELSTVKYNGQSNFYKYTYDNNSNRINQQSVIDVPAKPFDIDAYSRITTRYGSASRIQFSYDVAGNLTGKDNWDPYPMKSPIPARN